MGGTGSVQLVLLIVFNLVYLIYITCYSPSTSKLTNLVNAVIYSGFIICELLLFTFQMSDKSGTSMNSYSLALLAIMGCMVLLTLFWIIYRAILHVRH